MGKFTSFLYKTSNIVFIVISMILLTLISVVTGILLSAGKSYSGFITNTVAGVLNVTKDSDEYLQLQETIQKLFSGIHWEVQGLSGAGIGILTTFSICTGLIGMFVVFGILSAHHRRKIRKEGKQAIKEKKNGGSVPDMSDYYQNYNSNQKFGY